MVVLFPAQKLNSFKRSYVIFDVFVIFECSAWFCKRCEAFCILCVQFLDLGVKFWKKEAKF